MSIKKIKKDTSLRKSILQAAITGQLISDVDGTTETGKQLLDRIIEERNAKLLAEWKEALNKNPKAKKPTPVVANEISEDEIPFEIPENWCWCRLGDLIQIKSGDGLTSTQMKDGSIPVYGGNGITGYHNDANIHEETIVIGRVGFYCGSVHLTEKEAWVTDNAFISNYSKTYLNRNYLITALRQLDLGKQQNKTAQPVVSGKKIYPMLFPLPPLAVQNAIVAKLEEVLPLIDAYENAVLQKEELKTALPDKVKKAILQEAITGKLTEDWRKIANITEDGKQLLDRIITERNAKVLAEWEEKLKTNPKAKKPTPFVASEIEEDEIPFEIPESWCWCRLGELGLYRKGPFGSSLTKSMFVPKSKSSIKVYEQKNAIQKDFSLGDYYISKEKFDSMQSFIVEPEDIIVSCAGTIGEVYKLPKNAPIGIINQALMRVKLYNDELSAFWMLYFDYVLKKEASKQSSGTAIKNIPPFEILKAYPFPLPPLTEQKKIVKILEQMLPLCEKLGE